MEITSKQKKNTCIAQYCCYIAKNMILFVLKNVGKIILGSIMCIVIYHIYNALKPFCEENEPIVYIQKLIRVLKKQREEQEMFEVQLIIKAAANYDGQGETFYQEELINSDSGNAKELDDKRKLEIICKFALHHPSEEYYKQLISDIKKDNHHNITLGTFDYLIFFNELYNNGALQEYVDLIEKMDDLWIKICSTLLRYIPLLTGIMIVMKYTFSFW